MWELGYWVQACTFSSLTWSTGWTKDTLGLCLGEALWGLPVTGNWAGWLYSQWTAPPPSWVWAREPARMNYQRFLGLPAGVCSGAGVGEPVGWAREAPSSLSVWHSCWTSAMEVIEKRTASQEDKGRASWGECGSSAWGVALHVLFILFSPQKIIKDPSQKGKWTNFFLWLRTQRN